MHAETESGTTTDPAVPDLGPAARRVARLLDAITDDHLPGPTPCPEYAVRDLLQHLVGLTAAFRDAARKKPGPATSTDPGSAPPGPLAEDWRSLLPRQLGDLVTAWHRPEAWEGTTMAGGVTLPGQVAGVVALNELVIHGWDLARATGQEYTADEESVRACIELMAPSDPSGTEGLFGPVVEVPDGAPALDRAVGLSGRSPSWTPPATG
ncbi:TIGR03086 family protein [Streptomyces sp. WAC 00631]|uniref:TIGR03086 family metal-binding protein n=1 Tax=Streptomyces sp. WAC 00631 TaxID=2203201 RepID=UPI001E55598E|nr:TIGR03086 family metal-binding protein [Streptomyces sp. WAC 00631]MCC5033594.1 TIGR03086 family protein [Streptomyces sp. WAC 00631]